MSSIAARKKEGLRLQIFPEGNASYIFSFEGNKYRDRCIFDNCLLKRVSPFMSDCGEQFAIYQCSNFDHHMYKLPLSEEDKKELRENPIRFG